MADIIGFPGKELTAGERKRLEEFVAAEMVDIEDTACKSIDEIRDEIRVFFSYVWRFMEVFEDPDTKINPDLDFGLFLMEGRIRKIRGMIKSLFGAGSG